jgi:hypothetical protein
VHPALAAFNLFCVLEAAPPGREASVYPPGNATTVIYRVDAGSGRWCSGRCTVLEPLVALSQSEVVFTLELGGFTGLGRVMRVDLPDGRFHEAFLDYNGEPRARAPYPGRTMRAGRCARLPLTGFPRWSQPAPGPIRLPVPDHIP